MSPKITAKLCERHIVQTYHTRKQKKKSLLQTVHIEIHDTMQ